MKYALYLGRWQPLTLAHEWLLRQKLDKGIPCLVLVRDIPPDEKNPFTTQETIDMIRAAFKGEDVIVESVSSTHPNVDIESVNF